MIGKNMTCNDIYSDYDHYHQAHTRQFSENDDKGLRVKDVEIFCASEHKPMGGKTLLFPQSMLHEVVKSYNKENHLAPVVIEHPKTDAPAYGWVSDIRVEEDRLIADFSDIDPQFAELVKSGRYKKISSSFYQPDAINNPTPKKWHLKNVGFLGAMPPAVKGLKEARFSQDESGVMAFGEDDIYGLPHEYIHQIQAVENSVMIDKLLDTGQLHPKHRDQVLEFANALDNSESISFSDGAEHGKRDWFLKFLSEVPKFIEYGQYDMSESFIPDDNLTNVPKGFSVDIDGLALQSKANALAKAENISFEEAVQRLSK